jgi:hypothetical protein
MACTAAYDDDRIARYVAGELADAERDAFEAHVLDCAVCTRALEVLGEAPAILESGADLAASAAGQRVPSRLPAGLALAATLVVSLASGLWLGRQSVLSPAPDVVRSGPARADALAVAAVVDLEPDAEAAPRRAVTLLTCPAPTLGGAERLQVSLAGPGSQVAWAADDVDPVSGRVRVVVDLTGLESGSWALRLLRLDVTGRELGATACGFELR